jgi:hypothetical protein
MLAGWRVFVVALLFAGSHAIAMEQDPALQRYEARAIVTGTDMRSRPAGFAACLTDVLIKVSGDPRLAGNRAVEKLAAGAATFVADYDYWDRMSGIAHHDEQGSYDRPFDLTVRFVPERVDAALRDLGRQPWPDPRPELVMIIVVKARKGVFDLTRDEPRAAGMRAALANAGAKYGMHVSEPTAEEFATWETRPVAPSRVPVTGSLTWSEDEHGWVGAWRLNWQQHLYDWRIGGVNFDEAFREAVSGAMRIVSGNGAPG